jgi:hypothetical protein
MAKLTKKRKAVIGKVEEDKFYPLLDAARLIKEITTTKFDASVDLAVRLGVDPRNATQMVRCTVKNVHFSPTNFALQDCYHFRRYIESLKCSNSCVF